MGLLLTRVEITGRNWEDGGRSGRAKRSHTYVKGGLGQDLHPAKPTAGQDSYRCKPVVLKTSRVGERPRLYMPKRCLSFVKKNRWGAAVTGTGDCVQDWEKAVLEKEVSNQELIKRAWDKIPFDQKNLREGGKEPVPLPRKPNLVTGGGQQWNQGGGRQPPV